jgi:hypothetical protein
MPPCTTRGGCSALLQHKPEALPLPLARGGLCLINRIFMVLFGQVKILPKKSFSILFIAAVEIRQLKMLESAALSIETFLYIRSMGVG